jgi:hypothetical protein
MTMFTYNTAVPFATNNPSVDQPQMLINTVSGSGIWDVDHVGFNSTGVIGNPAASGGQHLQVTFNGNHTPAAQTDPLSVLYTTPGSASAISDMYFRNQNGTFPVNPIRAIGVYPGASVNGPVAALNQFNVATVTRTAVGHYTVVLVSNVVTGTNFGVLVSANTNISSYSITGVGTFSFSFQNNLLTDPSNFTFQVLQI